MGRRAGGSGGPTCEFTAQQLHPEGAVPPAHLGVQPDVLGLDGRREGVGVRGVVVHVPAEYLWGSKVCTIKKKIQKCQEDPWSVSKVLFCLCKVLPKLQLFQCFHCPGQVFSAEHPPLVSYRDRFATCAELRSLSCHTQKLKLLVQLDYAFFP